MTTEKKVYPVKPVYRDISRQRFIFSDGTELTYEQIRRLSQEELKRLGLPDIKKELE